MSLSSDFTVQCTEPSHRPENVVLHQLNLSIFCCPFF